MNTSSGRLIAIGDVHGCVHALEAILTTVTPFEDDHLIFLGDVVDSGRDTNLVLDFMCDLSSQCRMTLIMGNHEEMMLAARDNEAALRHWEVCGGVNTLNAYRFGGSLKDIPGEHWRLLESAVPYVETDKFIFTHANYVPELPMKEQPGHVLRWELFEPSEMQPHISGKRVIVGHTEQPDSEILDLGFAACIDTACWRHGWLTALDVRSGQIWQANRWGVLLDPDATKRERTGAWAASQASA